MVDLTHHTSLSVQNKSRRPFEVVLCQPPYYLSFYSSKGSAFVSVPASVGVTGSVVELAFVQGRGSAEGLHSYMLEALSVRFQETAGAVGSEECSL